MQEGPQEVGLITASFCHQIGEQARVLRHGIEVSAMPTEAALVGESLRNIVKVYVFDRGRQRVDAATSDRLDEGTVLLHVLWNSAIARLPSLAQTPRASGINSLLRPGTMS